MGARGCFSGLASRRGRGSILRRRTVARDLSPGRACAELKMTESSASRGESSLSRALKQACCRRPNCEDDEPTLELLCDHLNADRYEAHPAPSASDALRLCHYKQPDLLLLDLVLPDAPGLDVLREVRSADGATSKFDPELPVIVFSGRGSEADRVRGLREGADD